MAYLLSFEDGSTAYLAHHGIKGMKWGVWNNDTRLRYAGGRRNVKSFGKEGVKNATGVNLDRFGKDADHNVLYVTGLSGSGKSTVAESLRNESTNVIHLDYYLEAGNSRYSNAQRDPEFSEHLREKAPSFFSELDGNMPDIATLKPNEKQKVWNALNDFEKAIDSFGREQYAKGKNVVVEGVQLLDNTLYPNKKVFSDKSLLMLSTNIDESTKRAAKRDEIEADDLETLAIRRKWQKMWAKSMDDISKTAYPQRGEKAVESILNRFRD